MDEELDDSLCPFEVGNLWPSDNSPVSTDDFEDDSIDLGIQKDTKISYLTKEIRRLSLCHLLPTDGESKLNPEDMTDITYDMLQLYEQSSQMNERLSEIQHQTKCDLAQLRFLHGRLKETLEERESTIAGLRENIRHLNCQNTTLQRDIRQGKDEIRRLNSNMQMKDVHYRNDIRKLHLENEKLKNRLSALLADKSGLRIPRIEMSDTLMRTDGSRKKWHTMTSSAKQVEAMQKVITGSLEQRCSALGDENDQMRLLLSKLYQEMIGLLKEVGKMNCATKELGASKMSHLGQEPEPQEIARSTSSEHKLLQNEHGFQLPVNVASVNVLSQLFHLIFDNFKSHLRLRCSSN